VRYESLVELDMLSLRAWVLIGILICDYGVCVAPLDSSLHAPRFERKTAWNWANLSLIQQQW
jgi:hypothetical protein